MLPALIVQQNKSAHLMMVMVMVMMVVMMTIL